MLFMHPIPTEAQFAQERPPENRKKVADIQRHDGQHPNPFRLAHPIPTLELAFLKGNLQ